MIRPPARAGFGAVVASVSIARSASTVAFSLSLALALLPNGARADVTASIDAAAAKRKAISPLIYGSNQPGVARTSQRLGGNRWTAFNWENNASNAGSDYYFQNDGFLSSSNTAGAAVLPTLQAAAAAGRATILTVPIAGYVSADRNGGGDVRYNGNTYNSDGTWTNGTANANYLSQRFKVSQPTKGSALSLTPNAGDGFVYADEFVNWVRANSAAGQRVLYNLDNEPDLWSSTHAEIHPNDVTYAELALRNVDYAKAIKSVAPDAVVMGAVNYGWAGYRSLQGAPDAGGRDFQTYFLQQMKAADATAGKRLVDALDFHYYPEAQGGGVRVTQNNTTAAVAAARIQAPRSLWDPTYVESSWITRDSTGGQPIRLLPRTQALIDANNPGMRMAMTEYDFGAGGHISGGLAQADALGIFGEQGLYAANWWDEGGGTRYVDAAMRMYLNYDGAGGRFGDTAVGSVVSDNATASAHAAIDSATGKLTLVLINKSGAAQKMTLSLAGVGTGFGSAQAYQFDATSAVVNGIVQIDALGNVPLAGPGALSFTMDPLSVTTIVLNPLPEPATLGAVTLAAGVASRRRRA